MLQPRSLIVCLALAVAWAPTSALASPPNILLILADDVGREVLGCYGGSSYPTPHLDRLAAGGLRLDHCYSMPVCHPSRVCLLTGQYPVRLGDPRWGSFPADQEDHTLASRMRDAGYATVVAGKWQLTLMKDDLQQPERMGFDEWSLFGWHEGPRYHDPLIYENGQLRTDTDGAFGPDLYVEFLVDFMRRHRNSPFFAFYSMALCHAVTNDLDHPVPYGPQGRWMSYAEMAEDMDRQVGKLVAALDRLHLRDNTLILFTADNGTPKNSIERFRDGEYQTSPIFSEFNGRRVPGGKGELTDLGCRVPLIASWPSHTKAGVVSDVLVDFSDFLPTLLELAEAPARAGAPSDGHSFAGLLRRDGVPARKWAYAERKGRSFVRTQRFKLYSTGEFFDMEDDADEERPLDVRALKSNRRAVWETLRQAHAALAR